MGQVLPTPCDSALVERRSGPGVQAAVATMQGMRTTHEDTHVIQSGAGKWTLLGVFDGHGGVETAEYMSKNLAPKVLDALVEDYPIRDQDRAELEEPHPAPSLEKELEEARALAREKPTELADRRRYCSQKGVPFAPAGDDVAIRVKRAFADADTQCQDFLEQRCCTTSGCTATMAAVRPCDDGKTFDVRIFNAGDSRTFVISMRTRKVVIATRDHKPECDRERARIEEAGGFVSGAGPMGPSRVDGTLAVSRAFGDYQQKKRTQTSAIKQKVCAVPDAYRVTCEEGDIVVAACDGIFDVLTSDEVAELVLAKLDQSKEEAAEEEREGWKKKIRQFEERGGNSGELQPVEGQVLSTTSVFDPQTSKPDLGRICDRVLRKCLDYCSQDNMSILIARLTRGSTEALELKPPEMIPGSALNPALPQLTHDVLLRFHVAHGFPPELPEACGVCGSVFSRMWVCRCRNATYCSVGCQKIAWRGGHKKVCTGAN